MFSWLLYVGVLLTCLGHGVGALKFVLEADKSRYADLAGYALRAGGFSLVVFGVLDSQITGDTPTLALIVGWVVVAFLAITMVYAIIRGAQRIRHEKKGKRDESRSVPRQPAARDLAEGPNAALDVRGEQEREPVPARKAAAQADPSVSE